MRTAKKIHNFWVHKYQILRYMGSKSSIFLDGVFWRLTDQSVRCSPVDLHRLQNLHRLVYLRYTTPILG